MNTTIQKWGNSLALRIPASFTREAHLHKGSEVDVLLTTGKIVIVPKKPKKYVLSEMVKAITKDNVHTEVDWGAPRGREIL